MSKKTWRSLDDITNEVVSGIKEDKVFGNAGYGRSVDFTAKDISRYATFGSKTYGKLGYDPFRDNSKFYNDNTNATADLERAYKGMWKLAGVGYTDTFGFGVAASKTASQDFKQKMDDYGSTREGTVGFMSNTMLSSGYTVGIMAAIASEELLLAGATALSGGSAAPLAIGEMGAVAARGAGLLGTLQKGVKAYDKVGDAVKSLSYIDEARKMWVPKQIGAFGKQLLPLQETFDFIRNADKFKDLSGLSKSLQGAGAIARDMRKIHLTNSESKLEASLAKDEVREELLNKWKEDDLNRGRRITDAELEEIDRKAQQTYDMTYGANVGLIYATNAITFDSMFKSMRMTNKMFGMHDSMKFTVGKKGGNLLIKALDDSFTNYAKREISKLTWKGTAKKLLSSSMEGFQEVGQDLISGTAKRYSSNEKLHGNLLDSMYDAMGDMSMESFMSGMLMGTFASPVGKTIEAVNKFTVGGGYQAVVNPNEYAKQKEYSYKQAEKKAEELTKFFNETGGFAESFNDPIFEQSLSAENMLDAAEKNDRKEFEDQRSKAFRSGIHTLMKTGMDAELLDYLDDLNNYSAQELNEAFNRTDITEENKQDTLKKVQNYSEKIKSYRVKYDEIEKNHVNPVITSALNTNDPEYQEKKFLHLSHEKFKEELLFSQDRIEELAQRQKELVSKITNNKFTTGNLNTILSKTAIDEELELLEQEVQSDKEYKINTPESKKKAAYVETLKKFSELVKEYDELGTDVDATDSVYTAMFDAYDAYVNHHMGRESTPANRVENKKSFELYWDHLNLKGESEVLYDYVNLLNDPAYKIKQIQRINESLKYVEDNKKELIKKSLEAFYEKKAADEMISELLEKDIVFDHEELDDIIEKGIMPSKFYDVKTHKELTGARLKEAQDLIEQKYKTLTGKSTGTGRKVSKTKSKSDKRTAKELLNTYGKEMSLPAFISKLLQSKYTGFTEREVLGIILERKELQDVKVELTDNGNLPIEFLEDGTIRIDVRFASSDFKEGAASFEILSISALLQNHLKNQLDNNPALKADVKAMMDDVKEYYIEHRDVNRVEAANMSVFNDPVVFLTQALNDKNMQGLLSIIEDTTDVENIDIAKTLKKTIKDRLGRDFQGQMLDRAMNIAYVTLTNVPIVEEVEEEEIPTPTVEEKDDEVETSSTVVEQDDNGNLIINKNTQFSKLPQDLQELLAIQYLKDTMKKPEGYTPGLKPSDETQPIVIESVDPFANTKKLTPDDISAIEKLMGKSLLYINIIGKYNLERNKKVEVDEEVKPIEQDVVFTIVDLIDLIPDVEKYFSAKQLQNRINKINAQTSPEGVKSIIEKIIKEVQSAKVKEERELKKEEEEEIIRNDNYEINSKTIREGLEVNGKLVTINKSDIGYFLQTNEEVLYQFPNTFNKIFLDFINNSKEEAAIINENGLPRSFKTVEDLQEYIDSINTRGILSSTLVSAINKQLKLEDSEFSVKRFIKNKNTEYRVIVRKDFKGSQDVQQTLDFDNELNDQEEYEKLILQATYWEPTIAELILSNQYEGELESLTDSERKLYDLIQEKRELESNYIENFEELDDKYNYKLVSGVVQDLLVREDVTLAELLTVYNFINVSAKQRKVLLDGVYKKLNEGLFKDKVVLIYNQLYSLIKIEGDNYIMQNITTSRLIKEKRDIILSNIKSVFDVGQEYNPNTTDTSVTVDNSSQLSESLSDIFNNFTSSMTEFEELSEKDLMNSIVNEFNKCK